LSFQTATAIDLAGRDILEAVQTSVNPKVIDCPDPKKGKETVDAVAQDGIQLKAKARVTVRANIQRLIGGATEETVIATRSKLPSRGPDQLSYFPRPSGCREKTAILLATANKNYFPVASSLQDSRLCAW
jgi:hypothetical protein